MAFYPFHFSYSGLDLQQSEALETLGVVAVTYQDLFLMTSSHRYCTGTALSTGCIVSLLHYQCNLGQLTQCPYQTRNKQTHNEQRIKYNNQTNIAVEVTVTSPDIFLMTTSHGYCTGTALVLTAPAKK